MSNTGCCKDEKKQIKISSEQQKSNCEIYCNTIHVKCVNQKHSFYLLNVLLINKLNSAYINGPPILVQKNKQVFLSTFLI